MTRLLIILLLTLVPAWAASSVNPLGGIRINADTTGTNTRSSSVTITNSTDVMARNYTGTNSVKILSLVASRAAAIAADKTVTNALTTLAELNYSQGLIGNIQDQIDAITDSTNSIIFPTASDMEAFSVNLGRTNLYAVLKGRDSQDDPGGGLFIYLHGLTTATNGGTVFYAAGNIGRWVRLYFGPASVTWFGAEPNGSDDNTAPIQLAIDSGLDIDFPEGPANYNFASTLLFDQNRNYTFTPVSRLFYTGTGTAFNVTAQEAQFTGLVLEKQTRDFSDDSIGMLVTAFAHTQQHVNITKFTTGIKIEPTGSNIILENRWFVDISFAEQHVWINATNIGGITSQTFYSPNLTGTSRAESLYGFRFESTNNSPMTSCTIISGVVEHTDKGFYLDAHGQGFQSIGGDWEDNNHHFYFGPQSEDRFWQLGGLFSGRDKPFYPESAENPDFEFRFLPSAHGQDYDTLFLDGGLFRGQKQGWWNLLKNSTFDSWVSANVPTNWTVSGFATAVTNTTSGQFGPYSVKLAASGGDGYLNSVQGTNNLAHYRGIEMIAVAHVKASQAEMIRINVDDGITSHNGEEHSGSGEWEYIIEVFTLSTNATQYSVFLSMEDGSTNVYVDWIGLFAGDNYADLLPAQSDVPGMLTVAADTETVTLRPQRFGQPYGLAYYVQGNPTRQAMVGFKTGGGSAFTLENDIGQTFVTGSDGVGVGLSGIASVNASAALDVTSTTRGFLPPRMSEAQRDAISGPANGLMLYNTNVNKIQAMENAVWVNLSDHEPSDGDKGDITVSGSGLTWTIDNSVVTYAKMQNVSAASRLLGRGDSGSGAVQEVSLGSGLTMTGTVLSSTGSGGTITGASNLGTGLGVFAGTTGSTNLSMNSLAGANGITVSSNASTLTVALTVTNHTTLALTSPTAAVSVSTNLAFWSPPFASTLKEVRFKLLWPSTSGSVTVDLYKNGTTVLSAPVSMGVGVTNSTATLSVTTISANDVFTGAISGAGTSATNLQAQLLYTTP